MRLLHLCIKLMVIEDDYDGADTGQCEGFSQLSLPTSSQWQELSVFMDSEFTQLNHQVT